MDEEFLLKPMNCPHHCEIYGYRPRSYRELFRELRALEGSAADESADQAADDAV